MLVAISLQLCGACALQASMNVIGIPLCLGGNWSLHSCLFQPVVSNVVMARLGAGHDVAAPTLS